MVVYHANENIWFSCESGKTKEFFQKRKDCRFVWLLWSVCHGHVCWQLGTFYEPVEKRSESFSWGIPIFSPRFFAWSLLWNPVVLQDWWRGAVMLYRKEEENARNEKESWLVLLEGVLYISTLCSSIWYHMFLAQCLLDTFSYTKRHIRSVYIFGCIDISWLYWIGTYFVAYSKLLYLSFEKNKKVERCFGNILVFFSTFHTHWELMTM